MSEMEGEVAEVEVKSKSKKILEPSLKCLYIDNSRMVQPSSKYISLDQRVRHWQSDTFIIFPDTRGPS